MKRETDLGPQIAIYRKRQYRWRDLFLLFLPGGLVVLAPLGYGLYRSDYAYTHFGPTAAVSWSRPYYLFSTFALIILILLSFYLIGQSRRSVSVHKNGLHLSLPRSRILRWEQIAGVSMEIRNEQFLGIPFRTRYRAAIYPAVGKPIRLDSSFEDMPELMTRLKAGTYPRLLPKMRSDLLSGHWIYFGPISIHLEGMRIRNRKVPWADIHQVTVRSGSLMVELDHRSPIHLPVSTIPNLELLIQLIQTGINA